MSMPAFERRQLERLRYWQGQRLLSQDALDALAVEDQLRWWHNRALHGAYGIVDGLTVRPTSDRPGWLVVGAGLAYDAHGRELLLPSDHEVRIPTDQRDLTLLARYRESTATPARCEPEPCRPDGRPRVPERLVFNWKSTRAARAADGVPLARLRAGNGDRLELAVRQPIARPLARPRIGRGATPATGTAWEPWSHGVQVRIDTSAAGFASAPVPCYLTQLQGRATAPAGPFDRLLALEVAHVAEATHEGFTLRVWLPGLLRAGAFAAVARFAEELIGLAPADRQLGPASETAALAHVRARQLRVAWIGVQNLAGHADDITKNGAVHEHP